MNGDTLLQADLWVILFFLLAAMAATAVLLGVWGKRATAVSPKDGLTLVFVALVGLAAFTGWAGVLLASFGQYSLVGLATALLLAAGGGWLWQRPLVRPRFAPLTRHELTLLVLLPVFALLYFRPHEYVLGGSDAGTYMNIAATLAQSGDFLVEDSWTPLLREYADLSLRQQPPQWRTQYLQFVGWYISDTDPAQSIPQFFPLHPALLAVGIGLGGLKGGLWVTPVWGLLALTAVYLLARKLFDRTIALLAAILLGVTPTHIFFARYPTTEPLTLVLVFAGLLAIQQLWDEPESDPIWGVWGGLVLGAAFLTRIDLPLLALLLFAFAALARYVGRWGRGWTTFALTFGLLLLHSVISSLWLNFPYTWNTYSGVWTLMRNAPLAPAIAVGLALLLLATAVWAGRRGWLTPDRVAAILADTRLRWLLATAVILLSLYAYFLRPVWEPARTYIVWPGGVEVPILDGQNWLRLGWYLTPLGLLLATAGLAWLLVQRRQGRYLLFLSVGMLTTFQYVYRIFNTPYHIYTMRRYVPIIIPMLMIYTAVAIVVLARTRERLALRLVFRLAGWVLAVALLVGLMVQSRYVLPQQDLAGAVAQLAALEAELQPGSVLIINEAAESDFADRFGVPLRFIWGHEVVTVRQDGAGLDEFLATVQAQAAEEARPLQLLAVQPLDTAVRQTLSLQPVTMVPINLDMLKNTFTEYPSEIRRLYYGVEIYDVGAQAEAATETMIDIGTLDAAYIEDGFYYKEPIPGQITMRWTGAEAVLTLPVADDDPVTIDVRALIYRPEGVPPTPVTVWLDGREIGQFTPERQWQTFTFSGRPDPVAGVSELRFVSQTFNPAVLGLNGDGRDLGFVLDWVKIGP